MAMIQRIYNKFIRPHLPSKVGVLNGVPVKDHSKLLDATTIIDDYEDSLIDAIRSNLQNEDDVVIIGGGYGVSSVVARNTIGKQGTIKTYEGSKRQYNSVKNTIELNKYLDYIQLEHAIVGSYSEFSSTSYGDPAGAKVIDPENLPDCDVLILDCEGAEKEILREYSHKPRTIIVEVHGFLDSTEDDIKQLLSEKGYKITNRGVEMESQGVYVLTAELV